MVENFHRGAAVVVDSNGHTMLSIGDTERPIYPRSAIKPLQAIALIESGAADRFQLGHKEIALACASHSGETEHTDIVRQWLTRLGTDGSALECGTHYPTDRQTRIAMTQQCLPASAVHNNCSGKHAGFISVASFHDWPIAGYIAKEHPVQQLVLKVIEEVTEYELVDSPAGVDGCGIPVVGMSLVAIARGFSTLAAPQNQQGSRRKAMQSICAAMAAHPQLIGGTGRFCSFVPLATAGRVLVKVGAQGVYAGLALAPLPLGFALKIDDGSRHAAQVAASWLISKYCQLEHREKAKFQMWTHEPVQTVAKKPAGEIRPAKDLLQQIQ